MGVPPVLFVYFTVKLKVVVGVPLLGEPLPSDRGHGAARRGQPEDRTNEQGE